MSLKLTRIYFNCQNRGEIPLDKFALKHNDICVIKEMALFGDNDKDHRLIINIYPSIETISRNAALCVRAVKYSIDNLVKRNILVFIRSRRCGNKEYNINLDNLKKYIISDESQKLEQKSEVHPMQNDVHTMQTEVHPMQTEVHPMHTTLYNPLLNNIYIDLFEKSNKKADQAELKKYKENYGRTDKQLEDLIDKINSYNLENPEHYNKALNRLSYVTYMQRKTAEEIEIEMNNLIANFKKPVESDPAKREPRNPSPVADISVEEQIQAAIKSSIDGYLLASDFRFKEQIELKALIFKTTERLGSIGEIDRHCCKKKLTNEMLEHIIQFPQEQWAEQFNACIVLAHKRLWDFRNTPEFGFNFQQKK